MMAIALPSTWRRTTLGEVAAPLPNAIVDGPFGSNLKTSDYVDEGIPVLQGKNITNDRLRWFDIRFVSKRKAAELKRSSVRVGDILIVKIGSIGYSAIVEDLNGFEFAIIPANLAKVTPDTTKVDLAYLHKWLTSVAAKQYLNGVASKTAQPALSLQKIKSLPLPLPPLTEQRRIAAVLDRAEALRAKRRAAFAQLDTLIQSIFLDLFGDPASNAIPWPLVHLGEHTTKIGSGSTPTGGQVSYKVEGISLIRSLNVRDGEFSFKDLAFIDNQQAAKLAGVVVEAEDVLLNITGASVARVCRAPLSALPARVNQHVCIIRPKPSLDPVFLEKLLLAPQTKRRLLKIGGNGATREAITKAQIEQFAIICPPILLQREFSRRVAAVERLKMAQRASLLELNALFASLQQRAFEGHL